MALKVPTAGENALLLSLLGKTTPAALSIRLFTNDIAPSDSDTTASYTEMASLGYARESILTSEWYVTQNTGVAEALASAKTWTFTEGVAVSVYGYFVVGTDGVIRWAERFPSALEVGLLDDSITITPRFTLSSV